MSRSDDEVLTALPDRNPSRRMPIMLAATTAVLLVVAGIFLTARSARDDTSPSQPAAAESMIPSTPATTSAVPASPAQSDATPAADADLARILSGLAASVPIYPGAEPADGKDAFGVGDYGHQLVLSRVQRAAAPVTRVVAWYHQRFPHPHGWSPLTNGHAELDVTPAIGDDITEQLIQPHVQLLMDGRDAATTITVRSSGYPIGGRTDDTLIPTDQIVSASIGWRSDDATTPALTSRILSTDDAKSLIDFLNAATVLPEMTSGGLGKGVSYTLTFIDRGHSYRASYDSALPLAGTTLDFGTPSSRRLDLPNGFYALLERLSRP